jgi:hypothetical protein
MRRYFAHFLIAALLMTGTLAGFNWWVDPYAIYRDREILLQQAQPILVMNERVFKTVALAHTQSDVLLLGTSRTDAGIGRNNAEFKNKRVLNLATYGQPIRESRRLMEMAIKRGKPKIVLLGLDFFAFNAFFLPPADFVEENYDTFRPYSLLLSVSTLDDSIKAIRLKVPSEADCCFADGFRTPYRLSRLAGKYRQNFMRNEWHYLLEQYTPEPTCRFSFDGNGPESTLDEFRQIVELAGRYHIDLRLFISPAHARQWETLAVAGLWGQWEDWKRQLVRINEEETYKSRAAFPLWDFSGYGEISTESVPRVGESRQIMHWYIDSTHYTPELGEHIVQQIFRSKGRREQENWGVMLNSINLDAHMEHLRLARMRYRATHPEDVAEIENAAREVDRVKHCPTVR